MFVLLTSPLRRTKACHAMIAEAPEHSGKPNQPRLHCIFAGCLRLRRATACFKELTAGRPSAFVRRTIATPLNQE